MTERPALFLMTNTLETGGSERQFVALSKAIDPEHFRIQLGCLRRYGPLAAEVERIGEFPLGGSFFTWQAGRSGWALARELHRNKIAVAHAFDFYTNLMLPACARLARVPVIIGSHRQLGDLLRPLQFRAQGAAFRFCDRVVCNSQAAAGRLSQAGVPDRKLVVIVNGLPREAFLPAVSALAHAEGTVRVGMIARMNVLYKNQAGFLRAAAQVHKRCAQAEFILVGDGAFRSEFEASAKKLGLASRVRFLGERKDIPAVLAALDLLVVPSVSESLPNVILEAMAAGVPVVASRVGGVPEVIEHEKTGLLVPPSDDLQLAEAIERFVCQPSLRLECARRARQYVAEHFDWGRVSDQYEELYCDLLVQKDRGWEEKLRRPVDGYGLAPKA
jgi:L-malate glycosyltransferase